MPAQKRAPLKRRTASRTRSRTKAAATKAIAQLAASGAVITAAVPPLAKGEVYAGVIVEKGAPKYHIVLLPGEATSVTWADAKAFAEKAGGALPTRKEQALLFANAAERFEKAWYWSGEEYAGDAEYAWDQGFGDGLQGLWHEGYEGRARAVRRVSI
jgi:hypothetical protein